jgi:spore germination protein GerM
VGKKGDEFVSLFYSEKVKTLVIPIIAVTMTLSLLTLTGCFNRQPQPPQEDGEPMDDRAREIILYFDASTPQREYLAPETRKVTGDNLPLRAIQELIKGPAEGSDLKPVLPKEAEVKSVRVEDGIAYVDFNKEFPESLNVGSSGEALVISAIVNTLTEFPEIQKVQILIEGEKRESLAGHLDISQPLERNEAMIRR